MLSFPVIKTAKERKSVRNYLEKPLSQADREEIRLCIDYVLGSPSPFGTKIRIRLFDVNEQLDSKKLGTYGVIKNARSYLGVAAEDDDEAMEAVGYTFEKVVLYAQSIGLGTCWLGGTFNRGEFAKAMEVTDREFFPIASPLGYAAPKSHTVDRIMRKAIKADSRKSWETLFFEKDFSHPLSQQTAGEYADCLEAVRLAPSAKNAQPWRVVKDGDSFHFYEKRDFGGLKHDIQRLDVGIALCHFELMAKEKNISGHITRNEPGIDKGELIYVFSWVKD